MTTSTSSTQSTITFEKFWRWVLEHPNCILRAGSTDTVLFDHDAFHWDFFEEEEGNYVVQLMFGKSLVGEMVIERGAVVYVQGSIDVEEAQRGYWLFEVVCGTNDDNQAEYHFLFSHGLDQAGAHQQLKH